jgi:redox-sensitive bicupin YhaK (pirin superfamily)
MRSIKKIHKAEAAHMGDLITYRALPTRHLDQIDPFIFLNHHGPQRYSPDNMGLPFGPHPHRGMETVTFIIDGDIMHKDNTGQKSTINAGGIQWMTAGKGVIHAETSSEDFQKNGGQLEILQLWLNLPARLKMTEPFYSGCQEEEIPVIKLDHDKVKVQLISGDWDEQKKAAFKSISNIFLRLIHFKAGAKLDLFVKPIENVFFYVVRGALTVNGAKANMLDLVEFNNDGDKIDILAEKDSILIFGHAKPFNEPVVAKGPFVMNTEQEIAEAYRDFKLGKFGDWKE